jgi:hypothetical protein
MRREKAVCRRMAPHLRMWEGLGVGCHYLGLQVMVSYIGCDYATSTSMSNSLISLCFCPCFSLWYTPHAIRLYSGWGRRYVGVPVLLCTPVGGTNTPRDLSLVLVCPSGAYTPIVCHLISASVSSI